MKKNLVAYFSASGVTARTAKKLAETLGADLFEIQPKIPYSDADLDWTNKNSRSTIEMNDSSSRPIIANRIDNISDYDAIFVGFPIWWYVAPTIINSFLESYDLTNKTIIPFATSGGSGMGRAKALLKVSCPNSKLLDGKVLNRLTQKEMLDWVNKLEL